MKNLKKIIIIVGIIILIITIIIFVILFNRKKMDKGILDDTFDSEEERFLITETTQRVSIKSDYYMVQNCIDVFYKYYQRLCNNINMGETEYTKELDTIIFQLLDKDYVKDFNVNSANLIEKLGKYEDLIIDIDRIYVQQVSDNTSIYFIYGNLINKKSSEIQDLAVAVKTDLVNRTFSILPFEYLKEKNFLNIKENEKIKTDKFDKIERNSYNQIDFRSMSDERYLAHLFNQYQVKEKYKPEEAWDLLNEEYRNKRFKNINNYIAYIKSKPNTLDVNIKKYKKTEYPNYTQYICMDEYDNMYIFRETAFMKYTVLLDFYTLDLEEITNKYNDSSDQQKIVINIQKIVAAINSRDYDYIYSKLSDEFKNNYYKTIEDFANYMNSIFSGNFSVIFNDFNNEGNICIYNISLQGIKRSDKTTINMQIIMKLIENDDFIMSFNIKQ